MVFWNIFLTLIMNQKINNMKFIKDEDRRDYIFQKDKKTKIVAGFVAFAMIILVSAVAVSGIFFEM